MAAVHVAIPDLLNGNEPRVPRASRTSACSPRTGRPARRACVRRSRPRLVNELRGGWQWSPLDFYGHVTPDMFEQPGRLSAGRFTAVSLIDPTLAEPDGREHRNTTNWNIDNTLSWLRGTHSLVRRLVHAASPRENGVDRWCRTIDLRLRTTNFDPANAMFSTANFPGASTHDLTDARALYGLLTGRVTADQRHRPPDARPATSTTTSARAPAGAPERVRVLRAGFVALDADADAELRPALGTAAAVACRSTTRSRCRRSPISAAVSGIGSGPGGRQCNIFSPARSTARRHAAVHAVRPSGNPGYETDWNNFAPNVGAAWRPNVQDGWLRTLLGDPDQATVRAGYRGRLHPRAHGSLHEPLQRQPGRRDQHEPHREPEQSRACPARAGRSRSASRTASVRQPFPGSPSYPLTPSLVNGDDINIFDPAIKSRTLAPGASGCSARSRTTWRSTSATSAPASSTAGRPRTGTRSTCSRTDFWTSSRSRRRTSGPMWRPAAARPATRLLFCLPRARHGHVSPADLPGLLCQDSCHAGQRCRLLHRRHAIHQQRVDRSSRRVRAGSASTPATICTRTPPSAPMRSPPACPPTSSS